MGDGSREISGTQMGKGEHRGGRRKGPKYITYIYVYVYTHIHIYIYGM
jgi:hypothetical protein